MESVETELCFPHLNSSCRKPQTDPTDALVTNVLLFICSLLTATLNLLVIISIAHFRQLHTSTNFILLSLAVSDFFIGLVVMPLEGLKWTTCWTLGDLLCALSFLLPITLIIVSVGNIVLISVDRYVAICDPFHYATRMTTKVVNISISVCWIYAFIYANLVLTENFKNPGKYKSCDGECMVFCPLEVDILLAFIIPISIIVVLYMRVFVIAVSQARIMRSHVTALTSRMSKKSEIKAARNLGVVVLVYLMCYTPYYCVAYSGTNITILGIPLYSVTLALVYLNSFLNPLIYAMLYPWFRKTIKLIITLQIVTHGSRDISIFYL